MEQLKKFWSDEQGLETVEYAIMAGLIVIGAIVVIQNRIIWLTLLVLPSLPTIGFGKNDITISFLQPLPHW